MSESSSEQVNSRAIVIQRAGELSEFVTILQKLAVTVEIHDGPGLPSPDEVANASVVIVAGKRLLEGRTPNLSLWPRTLAVADNASKTMLAHLNRVGASLVIRRPIHPRTLRLVLLHQLYRGPERRKRKRTHIGHPIRVGAGLFKQRATLLELSDTGARVELPKEPKVGMKLNLLLGKELTLGKPLKLSAKVVRGIRAPGENGRQDSIIGVAFVDPRQHHKAVSAILDRFAAGPASWSGKLEATAGEAPAKPTSPPIEPVPLPEEIDPEASARRLPPTRAAHPRPAAAVAATPPATGTPVEPVAIDEPAAAAATAAPEPKMKVNAEAEAAPATDEGTFHDDLTEAIEPDALPDPDEIEFEADFDPLAPPVEDPEEVFEDEVASALDVLGGEEVEPEETDVDERRSDPRIPYDRRIVALGEEAARVLVGRDLSHGGMRIGPTDAVDVGDTLRVALHCGTELEPLVVLATALRDDGVAGVVLEFQELSDGQRDHLEKIIASSSPLRMGRDEDLFEKSGAVVMGEMLETISKAGPPPPKDKLVDSDDEINAHLDDLFDAD
ncbi:MAG: PilZ domain-containing protein [bacterium]|nr:PilZ domain-containing protein [bacterium]